MFYSFVVLETIFFSPIELMSKENEKYYFLQIFLIFLEKKKINFFFLFFLGPESSFFKFWKFSTSIKIIKKKKKKTF